MVRLRLRRLGKKKQPFYRIVAIDSRNARDGRYIENLGFYNPIKNPAEISLAEERALYWLQQGAIPSFTVKSFLKRKGILLKWHLTKQGADETKIDEELKKWEVLQLEREKKLLALDDQAKRKKLSKKKDAAQEEPEAKIEQEAPTEDKSEAPVAKAAEPVEEKETQPEAKVEIQESASESKTDKPSEAAHKEEAAVEVTDVKVKSEEKISKSDTEEQAEAAKKEELDEEIAVLKAKSEQETSESSDSEQKEAAQKEQPEEIKEVSDEVEENPKSELEVPAVETTVAEKGVTDKES